MLLLIELVPLRGTRIREVIPATTATIGIANAAAAVESTAVSSGTEVSELLTTPIISQNKRGKRQPSAKKQRMTSSLPDSDFFDPSSSGELFANSTSSESKNRVSSRKSLQQPDGHSSESPSSYTSEKRLQQQLQACQKRRA